MCLHWSITSVGILGYFRSESAEISVCVDVSLQWHSSIYAMIQDISNDINPVLSIFASAYVVVTISFDKFSYLGISGTSSLRLISVCRHLLVISIWLNLTIANVFNKCNWSDSHFTTKVSIQLIPLRPCTQIITSTFAEYATDLRKHCNSIIKLKSVFKVSWTSCIICGETWIYGDPIFLWRYLRNVWYMFSLWYQQIAIVAHVLWIKYRLFLKCSAVHYFSRLGRYQL